MSGYFKPDRPPFALLTVAGHVNIAAMSRWEKVGDLIRQRRIELGIKQTEAVDRAGGRLSLKVWSNLENNKQTEYRALSLVGVADALDWPADAVQQILDGADHIEPLPARPAHDAEIVGYANPVDLTAAEAARVDAYIDGLLDGRNK